MVELCSIGLLLQDFLVASFIVEKFTIVKENSICDVEKQ